MSSTTSPHAPHQIDYTGPILINHFNHFKEFVHYSFGFIRDKRLFLSKVWKSTPLRGVTLATAPALLVSCTNNITASATSSGLQQNQCPSCYLIIFHLSKVACFIASFTLSLESDIAIFPISVLIHVGHTQFTLTPSVFAMRCNSNSAHVPNKLAYSHVMFE